MISGGVTMMAALGVSSTANAEESFEAAKKRVDAAIAEYTYTTGVDGLSRVDVAAARDAGETEEILSALQTYNNYLDDAIVPEGIAPRASFPVYGNWCGPGHSGPGAPIDLLDRMCKNHDECYARKGYFDCGCDQGLLYIMKKDYAKLSTKAKAVSIGITAAISASMTVHGC
ncbi:hypothetical protein GCM10009793_22890 [Brachybacterium phenoliresistens]